MPAVTFLSSQRYRLWLYKFLLPGEQRHVVRERLAYRGSPRDSVTAEIEPATNQSTPYLFCSHAILKQKAPLNLVSK